MKPLISFFIFIHFIFLHLQAEQTLPGRVNDSTISMAKFGELRIFFYMTPKKHQLLRNFITDVSENLIYGVFMGTPNFPAPLVIPLVAIYPEPAYYDVQGQPYYVDQKGTIIFQQYERATKKIVEDTLNLKIEGSTQDMNLVLNFDAHKFHQDNFEAQYEFLKHHDHPIPKYMLVQDLTLMDWQMGKGTISGTLLQDPESKDRFLLPLFPGETTGSFYAEPAIYLGPNQAPDYPGHRTFPFHCVVPPIDCLSETTSGSAKGKRASLVLRGLVRENEIEDLSSQSQALPINRCRLIPASKNLTYEYPNGLTIKEIPQQQPLQIAIKRICNIQDLDSVEVYETEARDHLETIKVLQELFGLTTSLDRILVKHLIKKDGGFTPLSLEKLEIPKESKVILVNNSDLPEGYRFFNIAQDFRKEGLPWIQLYHLSPNQVLMASSDVLDQLLLTPTEEILFRDEIQDVKKVNLNILMKKITNRIDLFIFQ